MKKKLFVLFLVISLIMTLLFTGCGNKATDQSDTPSSSEITTEKEKVTDEGYRILKLATSGKIATLNPQRYLNSATEGTIVKQLGTRLYAYLPNDDFTAMVAKGQLADGPPKQVDEEGNVWHIKLKDDLVWSNGDNLDSEDVVYSFKKLFDPLLLNPKASNLLGGFISIKNAEQYYLQNGEGGIKTEWEEVGFKAIDNLTIEVITEKAQSPTEVMLCFCDTGSTLVYDKIFEETLSDDGTETLYGTSPDKMGYSGPYILKEWIPGAVVKVEKNPNYVFENDIKLAGIETIIVENSSTQMQLFEQGKIDFVQLTGENLSKYEQDPRVLQQNNKRVTSLTFNTNNPEKPILANINFRNAMYYGVDRVSLSKLIKEKPANFFISTERFVDVEKGIKYRDTELAKALVPENNGYNPELAKQYFETALKEEGIENVELTILYGDKGNYKVTAEFLQKSLPNLFGGDKIKLNLQAMPYTQVVAHRKTWRDNPTNYEITFCNWGGSTIAVWNGLKYHTSRFKGRNEPWTNEEFDRLWEEANYGISRLQEGKQLEYTSGMEKILFQEKPLVPLSQPIDKFLKSDRLKLGFENPVPILGFGLEYSTILE